MPTAIIKIDGDTSGLSRAFGDMRAQAKATENAIRQAFSGATAAAGQAAQRAEGVYRRSGRAARDESARTAAAQERDAHRAVAAYLREEQRKREAFRLSAFARNRMELEATAVARAEAQKRGLNSEQEARVRAMTLDRLTRQYASEEKRRTRVAEQEEKTRTRTAEREDRERATNRRRIFDSVLGGVGTVARGGFTVAREAYGMIQDTRQRRAAADRDLRIALTTSGGSESDISASRGRLRSFVEQTGMSYADVATALRTGQERGSSLEADPGESHMSALNRALSIIREANAEGADPGQYLAARGRLRAAGLQGSSLQGAMRFALAAANAGQVEVDQIIQQGLPGATRLMEQRVGALGPNATDEQRQAARLSAWRESVATQEVLAASGGRAGRTANTLASLQSFMSTPRRQELALTNIRTAAEQINTSTPEGRARAASLRSLYEGQNALFERDPTRRGNAMRLREGVSPIEFASRVAAATGGNAQTAANIFAGGGHGNAQAFLSNMRDLMGVLGGERGQRIQTMMNAPGLTDATIAEHQRGVEGDELSKINREQETRDNAVMQANTGAVQELTTAFRDFVSRNPITAAAAPAVGSALATVLGVKGGAALGVAGTFAANLRAIVTGRDLSGREISGGERLARAIPSLMTPLNPVLGMLGNTAVGARDIARAAGDGGLADAINRLNATLNGGINAVVSPVDANIAASQRPAPTAR